MYRSLLYRLERIDHFRSMGRYQSWKQSILAVWWGADCGAVNRNNTQGRSLCFRDKQWGATEAQSEAAYNTLVDSWASDTGAPMVLCHAVQATSANNTAVSAVISANANALVGPDFVGAWLGTHYLTASEINIAAGRMWTSLQALFY